MPDADHEWLSFIWFEMYNQQNSYHFFSAVPSTGTVTCHSISLVPPVPVRFGRQETSTGVNSLNPWRKQRSCWTWACGVLQAKKEYLGTVFLKELPFSKNLCQAEHFLSKLALAYMHFSQWKNNLLPMMLEVHSPSKAHQALIAWPLFGSKWEIRQQEAFIFFFNALYLAAKQLTKHKTL